MKKIAREIIATLKALGDPAIAEHSQRFFKTGKGEYGEGDKFLGIRVPVIRAEVKKQVKKHKDEYRGSLKELRISLLDTALLLLQSSWHEVRLFALLMMVEIFRKGSTAEKSAVYKAYLANTNRVNNWDLVDLSAHYIIGPYLEDKGRKPLYRLVRSRDLWERRIAIMSTFHFIRNNDFVDTLAISEILLQDKEDLIHKAVGWMLREVGNRHGSAERTFLKKHYKDMPRTMLRYAIEKFPEKERKAWLRGEV
ncbi:MAG: DNA alkylation repair protein [Bacteroidales bacterium]|nr:DNA alkylation repair protein [Candidatus Latescibacterota bacterium]